MKRATYSSAYGPEPKFEPGTILTSRQVDDASTWHNYMSSKHDSRTWLLTWLKDDPRLEAFKKLKPGVVLPTLGFWAKLALDGAILPDITTKRLNDEIDRLIARYTPAEPVRAPSHIPAVVQELLGVIRRWAADGDLDRSLTKYLQGVGTPPSTVKKAVDILREKKAGDPEVADFLARMVAEADAYVAGAPAPARKTRAKKVVPPEKRVAGLRYMGGHNEIVSVKPTDLLGAKEAFLFNMPYNVFTHLVAADDKGFDVKGAAIINIDDKKSVSRNAGRRKREILQASVPVLRRC